MKLTILKNKRTGQVSINIPKGVAELYKIDENADVQLLPKDKKRNEFLLVIERK